MTEAELQKRVKYLEDLLREVEDHVRGCCNCIHYCGGDLEERVKAAIKPPDPNDQQAEKGEKVLLIDENGYLRYYVRTETGAYTAIR